MRRLLLLTLLLALAAGCQGPECRRGGSGCAPAEPCTPAKPPVEAAKPAPPRQDLQVRQDPAPVTPVISQDILLVPKMVYIPYAPQTPMAPVRLAGAPLPSPAPEQLRAPAPPDDTTKQMLDLCKKLNQRIDQLEQCARERNAPPPTIVCPPSEPACPQPLLRRPLFPRLNSTFQNCDPPLPCIPECEPPQTNPPPTMLPMPKRANTNPPTPEPGNE